MADLAEKNDVNLLLAVGANPNSPFPMHLYRSSIYDLLSNETLDGLIMIGTLLTFLLVDLSKKFTDKYHTLPMVSILQKIQDIPSVLVDNKKATYEEVVHLIKGSWIQANCLFKRP